ncbi:MAG: Fe-Mn family superoxide dismutase [Candidatus Lustribacter sp.]|jgi:Fe-Mn family superoxide dismutase
MTTTLQESYTAKKWKLAGLKGISDRTLETHFGLYEGYVKNTNLLNEQRTELIRSGKGSAADLPFAELTRRLGFEYNGMVLHELYFDNLTANGNGTPSSGNLYNTAGASFGDFETWKKDFAAVGGMRGVGWAIAYQDPKNGRLSNHWVTLHEDGNVAGFKPILVMDVWEHAFLLDYKPSERSKYIEAFFSNVDWATVESRLARP